MANQPDPATRTENVYEGKPDARQGDGNTVTSRFRPMYRALTVEEKQLHDDIKAKAVELEQLLEKIPAGRYLSLGFTHLETAIMWAIKQLTS